jgi:tRNA 5-methylaminomethyl-2-thiouridine biosynthesis bifunctional protein
VKTSPITPARIEFGAAGDPPFAPDFGDVYHARGGALAQARHVFLGGNGLPQRWQRRARFVVLETGFGLGHNFLATWAAWRDDPQRCRRLWFVSIDRHPPTRADLARAHADSALASLAAPLVAAWPPLTPDLHTLVFDGGSVVLRLAFGDVAQWLAHLVLDADAVFLDGFAPARNPAMWNPRLLKMLAGRVAPDATAATWCVARVLREGLTTAGFEVRRAPGFGGRREMTLARFAPRFEPRRARPAGRTAPAEAVIVGGGLAGAAAAHALALEGWTCTVFDRHWQPVGEASGNAGGLYHGNVPRHDGVHARALRAAALMAAAAHGPLLRDGALTGGAAGLLQLHPDAAAALQTRAPAPHGLPPDWVRAVDRDEASALAGVPLPAPAWWFEGGGWIDPAGLVRHWLALPAIRWRGGVTVARLQPDGAAWSLLDAEGTVLARSATVVLANAHDAPRLLGLPPWPLARIRGQVTRVPAHAPGLPVLRRPLAGDGYALTLPDGSLLCGATRQPGDDDASLRAADHAYNLQRLRALTGAAPDVDPASLDGRVGWRLTAADRLPLIGAVPADGPPAAREREAPRRPGLFVCTGFGSRGITWAPLAGALVASWAAGAPFPVAADLVDAFDPARFGVRAARRVAGG